MNCGQSAARPTDVKQQQITKGSDSEHLMRMSSDSASAWGCETGDGTLFATGPFAAVRF
jgi:hypothetical protein